MSIIIDNTNINNVYFNGVRMEKVYRNNESVHTSMNGAVIMVASGNDFGTFNPGEEDINRLFIVVTGSYSTNALGASPVPIINGTQCITILNDVDNGNGDGGRCGVFYLRVPTGIGTFTISNTDQTFAVYRVVGIENIVPYATAGHSGGTSINISVPAKGIAFAIGVRNNDPAPALAYIDADLGYASRAAVGGKRINNATPSTVTIGDGEYSQMMRAVSFAYTYYQ